MLRVSLKEKWCGFGVSGFWTKCSVHGEPIVLWIYLGVVLNADYRFAGEGYWCYHSTLLLRLCGLTVTCVLCAFVTVQTSSGSVIFYVWCTS